MTIIVCTVGGVFLLWAAWWVYRGTPKHGTHRLVSVDVPPPVAYDGPLHDFDEGPPPMHVDVNLISNAEGDKRAIQRTRDAAHHPPPVVDPTGLATEAWEKAWALPVRHTHRDPVTGRFVRKGE